MTFCQSRLTSIFWTQFSISLFLFDCLVGQTRPLTLIERAFGLGLYPEENWKRRQAQSCIQAGHPTPPSEATSAKRVTMPIGLNGPAKLDSALGTNRVH